MRRSLNVVRLASIGAACALAALIVVFSGKTTEAHKGISSKYNYNEHIFPILRERCGSCHFTGGPAPMSLVDYIAAVPWAESIREVLIAQKMPPFYADPLGPAVKGDHMLPTKELDMPPQLGRRAARRAPTRRRSSLATRASPPRPMKGRPTTGRPARPT
jgi:hypothetical protein